MIWVSIQQGGSAIVGLITVKIMTHVLNPSEFGRLALANTIVFLIGASLFGPLEQSLMRFWSIAHEDQRLGIFYSTVNRFRKHAFSIAILGAAVIGSVLYSVKGGSWGSLIATSILVGALSGWLAIRTSILTAARKRKLVALLHTGVGFLRPLIAALLVVEIVENANMAMIGYLFATFAIVMLAERFYDRFVSETSSDSFRLKESVNISHGIEKGIFSLSLIFFLWGLFGWVKVSCDRWALQAFYGSDVVGAFTVVLQLATYPLTLGSGFLTTLFNPIAFQRAGNLNDVQSLAYANRTLIRMVSIYVIGAVILICLFTMVHRPLVLLISNERFVRFSSSLPWITAALAFYQLGEMLSSFGVLANRLQVYIIPKILSSIITGIGMFWFSAWIGPIGIVWGLALAGLVYTPWCIIKTWNLIRCS